MDAIAPIAWLQEQMLQGKVDKESATKALDNALELLENVSTHFNVERRKEVMKHLNSDLKYLAVKEFPRDNFSLFEETKQRQLWTKSGHAINGRTIWPGFGPLCVHKNNESGGDFSTQQRYPMHYSPERPPPNEQEPISPSAAYHSDARPPGSTQQ